MSDEDRTRYARAAMLVKTLFTDMFRKMAGTSSLSATMIYGMIDKNTFGSKGRLNDDELKLYPKLNTSGYSEIDESFMYKLIRSFDLVAKPSNGWGNAPTYQFQTTLGDDIERLRKKRNCLAHHPSAFLSEPDWLEFVVEVEVVAKRFDAHLGGNAFQQELYRLKIQPLDKAMETKYIAALEKILYLTKQYESIVAEKNLQIFYGEDIQQLIRQNNSATDQDQQEISWLNMYIRGIKDKDKALAALRQAVSAVEQLGDFVPYAAEHSSILLHVKATQKCFRSNIDFLNVVCACLSKLLPHANKYLAATVETVISVDTGKDDLFSDARKWRRVREVTLPRLRNVRSKLDEAARHISNARTGRNVALVLGVFGAILAPVTGGASLGPTMAVFSMLAGSVTLVAFVFEHYLTGDVLNEAQDRIDIDKKETEQLRQRVHYFITTGTQAERHFAEALNKQFPNVIITVVHGSFGDFIKSFINTEAESVVRARDQVNKLIDDLSSELKQVEETMARVQIYY